MPQIHFTNEYKLVPFLQNWLAKQLQIKHSTLSNKLRGDHHWTFGQAKILANISKMPETFWLNLHPRNYREAIHRFCKDAFFESTKITKEGVKNGGDINR